MQSYFGLDPYTAAITGLLVVANVTGTAMLLPQAWRLWRHRRLAGVSPSWLGVGLAMNLWWTAYALALQLWGLVPISVASLGLYGFSAMLVLGIDRRTIGAMLAGAATIGTPPAIALAADGWTTAGVVIGSAYGVQFVPAAVAAVRSADVSGISTTTWTMAWVEAVVWLIYGFEIGDPALTVGGAGGGLAATAILLRLLGVRAGGISAGEAGQPSQLLDAVDVEPSTAGRQHAVTPQLS